MGSDAGTDALQLALRVLRTLEDLGAPSWLAGSLASSMFGIPVLGRDRRSLRELERRRTVEVGEDRIPIPVTSPEDIMVRKLAWYRDGGSVSDRQWRDALGVARVQGERLDLAYLREAADELEVTDLLDELVAEAGIAEPT